MSNLEEHKKHWRKLLGQNEWYDLFESMEAYLEDRGDEEKMDELSSFRGTYLDVYEQEMNCLIGTEGARVQYQKLRQGLLFFIRKLSVSAPFDPEETWPGGKERRLNDLFRAMHLRRNLGPYYLVNCNRQEPVRDFKRGLRKADEGEGERVQFYFTVGCDKEEPEGLAERGVFELIEMLEGSLGEGPVGNMSVVNYEREPNRPERVWVRSMPEVISVRDFQNRFKQYVAERFDLGNRSFEDFLKKDLAKRKEKYVVVTFSMASAYWDPDLAADCFQWIIDAFSEVKAGPKWMFFFVFWIRNVHHPEKMEPEDEKVFGEIKRFFEKNKDRITFLYPLNEVKLRDLEYWFQQISDIDTGDREKLIAHFTRDMSEEERRLYEEKLLHMERVERIQEKVYEAYRKGIIK